MTSARLTSVALALLIASFPAGAGAQITSTGNGLWSNGSTWVGGIVPDSTDNVVIDVGDTVTVDAAAQCLDLSFADVAGRLGLQSNLYIYGNLTRFDTSVNPFYGGTNLWLDGAKMVFAGGAAVQTINNLGITSTSPYPLRLQEVVVDKWAGKLTTNAAGTEADYKIAFGTSLEVVNGTFELGRIDDIEGRNTSGISTTPTITVQTNGSFTMLGSTSHIRRGNFTGEETSKIGKMTIHGVARLASSSSNRVNFTDIDIESGGELRIIYYSAGGNMGTARFNPGTVTVKDGGEFNNSLNTDIWFVNATTPNQLAVLTGGTVDATATAPVYPSVSVNQGTFRYSRDTTDQIVYDMDYYNLELSFTSGFNKLWTLGADRVVSGELEVNNTANLVISSDVARSVTVGTSLRLTSGGINNSDPEVALTLADGATVNRATGTLSNAPVFAGVADVRYLSTAASVTTGPELPTAVGVLRDLQVWSTGQTVTLGTNAHLHGELTLSNGDFDNNGAADNLTLTLASGAIIRRGSGALLAAPVFAGTVDVDYISTLSAVTTGPELPTGSLALSNLMVSGTQGVTLGAGVTVNGTCTISGSDLTTGSHTVTLGPSATLVESAGTTILGRAMTARAVSQFVPQTFGGLGLDLTAAGAAPGATTVLRVTGTARRLAGSEGIERYFEITPAVNSGLNATAVVHYDESELNGIGEALLEMYAIGAGGYTWQDLGGTVDVSANTVTTSGIGAFYTLTLGPPTLVAVEPGELPQVTRLLGAYPNPLRSGTTIAFELSRPERVTIAVYDVTGRRVRTLQDGMMGATRHEVRWSGVDDAGQRVATGVYFCRLTAGNVVQTSRLSVLR
jgi:hypothetical protein